MKIVFEGIVNGTKFDNVQEYNTALTQALQNNELTEASSKTRVAPANTGGESEPECCLEYHKLFPEFRLDDLNGDEAHDNALVEAFMQDELSESRIKHIIDTVNATPDEEYTGLITDYQDMIRSFHYSIENAKNAKANNLRKLANLRTAIRECEKNIDLLETGQRILNQQIEFYNYVLDLTNRKVGPELPKASHKSQDVADAEQLAHCPKASHKSQDTEQLAHCRNLLRAIFE